MNTFSTQGRFWISRSSRLLPALLALFLTAGFGFSSMAQNLLNEGFENSTYPPTGWTRTQSNSSYPWIRVTSFSTSPYLYPSIAAHTGSYMIDFQSFSAGSGTTADIATPVLNFTSTNLVQVSFWMYRDPGYSGYNNEKVDVYVNTAASVTGGTLLGTVIRWSGGTTTLAPPVSAAGWYKYTVNVPSSFNSATNYIIFRATSQYGNDQFLDDIKVDNIGPCTGPPLTATVSPSGTQTVCPGSTVTLTAGNVTVAANLNFQWWQSINGGTTWTPVIGGSGGNTDIYKTGAITANIRYRFHQICLNTGDSTVSPVVIFNVTSAPTYATLPFFEGFENWTSRCGTSDIPSVSWTNIAFTGNNSWRRDDQGSTAGWTTPTGGAITPIFKDGAHSARFHSYYANSGDKSQAGALSAYLNCSAVAGSKELQFYSHQDPNASYPQDSLIVDTSTDGGATFGVLAKYGAGAAVWDYHTITFPSNSATTVVRFRAWQNYNCTGCGYPDIYIDGVKVLPPCAGKPTAGVINPVNPCKGQNFTLSLTGTSASAGLGYLWQFRIGTTGPWTNLAGGTVPNPTANISVNTYFRAIVNCTNGGPTDVDTSAPLLATLASFYYCYCGTSVTYPQYPYVTISNIKIQTQPANVVLLNNGNPLPLLNNPNIPVNGYTDYRYTVPAPTLIQDSTYKMTVSEADAYTSSWYAGYTSVWIDYDRDGIFGNPGERILTNVPVLNSTTGNLNFNFTVPTNASVGLTGMRITMGMYSNTNPSPCGLINTYGEAEDYLVYIDYPPCTGPVNAGTAWISDTAVCPGYTVDLGDTSYEKQRTNITRVWQYTNNGGAVWFNIPGSVNKDTINNVTVTGASMYRLAAICTKTGDTSYSNVMSVSIPAPVRCYPYATAIGNPSKDSTDIGAFVIGSFVNPGSSAPPAGPHLNNPLATRRRTDYTLLPGIELYADTTYRLSIFQTMPRGFHSDALVSVFMDFNNDLQYNLTSPGLPFTSELVFQGVTHWDSFYLDTKITIPDAVIPNVPTGMRVVINNDLNPSNPGNTGVGGFTSGEVEDYVVVFRRAALGVGGTGNVLQSLAMYPNPTEGKFTVLCDAGKNVSHMEVVVSTITGQQVITRSYDNVGSHFTTELDLSTAAKGIYFVEVRADGDKITRKLIVR